MNHTNTKKKRNWSGSFPFNTDNILQTQLQYNVLISCMLQQSHHLADVKQRFKKLNLVKDIECRANLNKASGAQSLPIHFVLYCDFSCINVNFKGSISPYWRFDEVVYFSIQTSTRIHGFNLKVEKNAEDKAKNTKPFNQLKNHGCFAKSRDTQMSKQARIDQ